MITYVVNYLKQNLYCVEIIGKEFIFDGQQLEIFKIKIDQLNDLLNDQTNAQPTA